ncbi:MAG TPA: hypothetical protein VI451_09795 [Anaerolineales bacterium]|nr:hypothetical protein [Anaerolineales bacterium]
MTQNATRPMHHVECISSSRYAERPIALWWEGERREVKAIENQWRTPAGAGFRVRTVEGQIFELVYGENEDEWIIQQKS